MIYDVDNHPDPDSLPGGADFDQAWMPGLTEYTVRGENWHRRVNWTYTIAAHSATEAVSLAEKRRMADNKVPAHRWVTTPAA